MKSVTRSSFSKRSNSLQNFALYAIYGLAGIVLTQQAWAQSNPAPAAASAVVVKPASPCPPDWEIEICELKDVVETIKREHYSPVDIHAFLTEGIKRSVGTLSHAGFLDKKGYAEMWKSYHKGGYAGIGVTVGSESGYLKVEQATEDGPAEKAGIQPGDLLAEADGVNLRGMPFKESSERLRGEPGTKVVITVLRQPNLKKHYITIERAIIKTTAIKYAIVAPGYAWMRMASFQGENLVAEVTTTLKDIAQKEPNLKGFILDFRNNGGGNLSVAIGVTSAFLPPNKRVTTIRGRNVSSAKYTRLEDYQTGANNSGKKNEKGQDIYNDPLKDLPAIYKTVPMVVLVNNNTASAPELVSSALQDYGRATVLGKPTYGKGAVQTTSQRYGETGLTITTARYFTPSGCEVHGFGVTPNYLIDERPKGDPDPAIVNREVDIPMEKFEGIADNDPLTILRKERLAKRTEIFMEMDRKHTTLPPAILPRTFGKPGDPMVKQAIRFFEGKQIYQRPGVKSELLTHTPCGKFD